MPAKRYKPSRRLKPKRSKLKMVLRSRFFWFGLVGMAATAGIFYGIFLTPFLQIQHVEVQGAQKVSPEKLRELTREYLPGKFLFFKINNFFLANAARVAQEVQAAFPQVETVSLDTMFPNKVKVIVKERGAVAIWCQQKKYTVEVSDLPVGEDQVTRSFQECFALDSNGVIFEEREMGDSVVIQNGGSNAALGEQVVAPGLLSKVLSFQNQMDSSKVFQEVGLRVSSLRVISEERVNARISEGWEVYVNPEENIDWQATKAKLVLEQEVPLEKRPFLEYIDLRFGDQAYLKYR